ncbi:MAG: tetratricopeptide repeat protein, partial [Candidatus Marinimicrobia bacterium]|nr:tetratricopeptide repeat protein [Candidatus Neomarinimicrobiota bacterium]
MNIWAYNPYQLKNNELKQTFVGRDDLLDELIQHLRQQKGRKTSHHILITGPRGIGKTSVLLILNLRVRETQGLWTSYQPILFAEEEHGITESATLALRILEIYSSENSDYLPRYDEANKNPKEAMSILRDVRKKDGRTFLLLCDTFDKLAERIIQFGGAEEKSELNRFLTNAGFLVVGSSLHSSGKKSSQWVYERFQIKEMQPLREAYKLIHQKATFNKEQLIGEPKTTENQNEIKRITQLLKSLPLATYRKRINTIAYLSGGNPRLIVFLYDCLLHTEILSLTEIVKKMLDGLTPLYQGLIDTGLTPEERRTINAIARNGGSVSSEELTNLLKIPKPTVITYLSQLRKTDLVIKTESGRFELSPPIFQIWYEMRYMAQEAERSFALLHFLELYLSSKEKRKYVEYVHQQYRLTLGTDNRGTETSRVERAMSDMFLSSQLLDIEDPRWQDITEDILAFIRDGLYDNASAKLKVHIAESRRKMENHKVARYLLLRSVCLQTRFKYNEAIKLLEEAEVTAKTLPNKRLLVAEITNRRGSIYRDQHRFDEALELFREAMKLVKSQKGKSAQKVKADILEEAGKKSASLLEKAKKEIAAERSDAINQIKQVVV